MNCKKCGFLLAGNEKFCINCGSPVVEETKKAPIEGEELLTERKEESEQPVNKSVMADVNNAYDKISNISTEPLKNDLSTRNNNLNINNGNNQSFNTPNNMGMYENQYSQPKTNNTNKFLIIGIVIAVVVIIGLIVLLLVPGLTGNNKNTGTPESNNDNSTVVSNTVSVNYGGYTFAMPNDLISEITEDGLAITDNNETWVGILQVLPVNYNDAVLKKEELKTYFISAGFNITSCSEENIGGMNYLIFKADLAGNNMIISLNKAESAESFVTILVNNDLSLNTTGLEKLAPVYKTAKKQNSSFGIESNTNDIDLEDIFEKAIK